MKKEKKAKKRGRLALICCSVVIFIISFTAASFYFVTYKGLKLDHYLGNLVFARVANAQYLPNSFLMSQSGVSLLTQNNSYNAQDSVVKTSAVQQTSHGETIDNAPALNGEDCAEIIKWLGEIWTDDQSGMENGFLNITTVKDELYRVIAFAPAFDTWFSEGVGMQNLFRGSAYRVHYDPTADRITINCVSWSTDTAIFNYDTQKITTTDLFSGPYLRQFMEIDYYFNEDGTEVVEMSIYNVLIYKNKTYPVAYQYIKNVKDSSFTKIYILSNIRTRPTDEYEESAGEDYCPGAHDLENYNYYGAVRSVIQLDYSGNALSLLAVDQSLPSFYHSWPKTTYVRLYNKVGDDITMYTTAYDYSAEQNKAISAQASRRLSYDPLGGVLFNSFDLGRNFIWYNILCDNCANKGGIFQQCDHFVSAETVQRQEYAITRNISGIDKIDFVYKLLIQNIVKAAQNAGIKEETISSFQLDANKYYFLGDLLFENGFDMFLNAISKDFTDNFDLRDRADGILKEYKKSKIISGKENVSGASSYITVNKGQNTASIYNGVISYSISGSVSPSILLKKGALYSLSLVVSDGNYAYIIASDYDKYEGAQMDFTYSGSYDFGNLIIEKQGEYKLSVALTHNLSGKDYVVSASNPLTLDYQPFTIADTVTGYKTSYSVEYRGGNLYIIAEVIDIEPPKMIYNGTDKKIAFTNERPMTGTLIDYYEISDNEMIKSIKIYDKTGKEVSWRTQLKSGDYTIIVQDIYGNSLQDTLTIIIID